MAGLAKAHLVAGADHARRLHPLAVETDVAAAAGISGLRPRLHEPDGPDPDVDPSALLHRRHNEDSTNRPPPDESHRYRHAAMTHE
ncbi:hypothetical protein FMEAI12_3440005 [Parafrankia sp. Ea1.12]|nr:hypothetical protein FMEAI12_3440005 [Parafrankia sp. Ea1.12]